MGAQRVDRNCPAGVRRRERDGCGAEASAIVALVRLRIFEAEEVFAGYLRTDLAEKLPYPLDRYEVSLEIARFPTASGTKRSWTICEPFSPAILPI